MERQRRNTSGAAEYELLSEMEDKSREKSAAVEELSSEGVPVAARPSQLVTHTALLPTVQGAHPRVFSDPFEEFRCSPFNLDAANRCLEAACSVLNFVISEIWTYGGDYNAAEGKAVQPVHLHVYTKSHTIDEYDRSQEVLTGNGKMARDSVASELVYQARKRENGLVWYTSAHPDTPLAPELPMKTAVALVLSMDMFRKDLCFVFFAEDDVKPQDSLIDILRQLSRAAGVALAPDFPASDVEYMNSSIREGRSQTGTEEAQPRQEAVPVRLDVRWDELRNVEFMVNGSRCTIYTAFYGSQDVVAKVMRKDAKDKEAVQKELELEMSLLLRLRHANIVRLVGAGLHPEPFLLIERLDGGTLAQRCGNALKIRDRRRRFRYAKPFMYEELLQYGIQLAEALDYMHNDVLPGKVVLHRDLKPDNIAFKRDGTLKLIDLGMGKVVPKSSEDNAVYRLTGETGSLRYMAPEVALNKPYNGAADVYSFAILFWEMATMKKPFSGMGFEDYYREVVHAGVRPELNAAWPEELRGLLRGAWHSNMHERPSFKEIKGTFRRIVGQGETKYSRRKLMGVPHEDDLMDAGGTVDDWAMTRIPWKIVGCLDRQRCPSSFSSARSKKDVPAHQDQEQREDFEVALLLKKEYATNVIFA